MPLVNGGIIKSHLNYLVAGRGGEAALVPAHQNFHKKLRHRSPLSLCKSFTVKHFHHNNQYVSPTACYLTFNNIQIQIFMYHHHLLLSTITVIIHTIANVVSCLPINRVEIEVFQKGERLGWTKFHVRLGFLDFRHLFNRF